MAGPLFNPTPADPTAAELAKREDERKKYEAAMKDYLDYVHAKYGYSGRDFSKEMSDLNKADTAFTATEPAGGLLLGTGFHQGENKRFGVHFTRNEDNTVSFRGYTFNSKDMELLGKKEATKETVEAYQDYAKTLAQLAKSQGLTEVEISFLEHGESTSMTAWKVEALKQAFKAEGIDMSLDSGARQTIEGWDNAAIKKDMQQYLTTLHGHFPKEFEKTYQYRHQGFTPAGVTHGNEQGELYEVIGTAGLGDVRVNVLLEQVMDWKKEMALPPKPVAEVDKTDERKVADVFNNIKALDAAAKAAEDSPKLTELEILRGITAINDGGLPDDQKRIQKIQEIGNKLTELETKSQKLETQMELVTKDLDKLNEQLMDVSDKKALGAVAGVAEKELAARTKLMEALQSEYENLYNQRNVWENQIANLGEPRVIAGARAVPPAMPPRPEIQALYDKSDAVKAHIDVSAAKLEAAPSALRTQKDEVIEAAKDNVTRPDLPRRP